MGWGDAFMQAWDTTARMREDRRRYDLESAATAEERAWRRAQAERAARLEAERYAAKEREGADDQFLSPLEKGLGEYPEASLNPRIAQAMEELRGVRPYEAERMDRSPRNIDLATEIRTGLAEAAAQRERMKALKARGNATGLSFRERLALGLAGPAGKARGTVFVPRPEPYIGPDPATGKIGVRPHEQIAGEVRQRGATAAEDVAGLYDQFLDFGQGRPPRGPTSSAPPRGRTPLLPPAAPAAPRAPQAPAAPAEVLMLDPDGQIIPVPSDQVEEAKANGYTHYIVPGMR